VKLTVDRITRIAIEVAEAYSFPVRVLASVSSGASNYVEILVRINGGDGVPTLAQLGVFRDVTIDELRQRIADQIRQCMLRQDSL
jgi:hypothetical protein